MLTNVVIKPWLFLTVLIFGLLDVLTTMYALQYSSSLMEGNPAAAPIGESAGPYTMCLVSYCATLIILVFTTRLVPVAVRYVAYALLGVKVLVVVSNFVHIFSVA